MAYNLMANNEMPGQPAQMQPFDIQSGKDKGPPEWKNSLCGCFSDISICLTTCFLPCVQYGLNYETVNKTNCLSEGLIYCLLGGCNLGCCIHTELRAQIRKRYGIPESAAGDCLTTYCCASCAICQEARELKERG